VENIELLSRGETPVPVLLHAPLHRLKKRFMLLSRQQYVSGIIVEMRTSHGEQAHAIILKQATAFRRSGNDDLADVWDEAGRLMVWQDTRISLLAELGYVPEEPAPPR
jgi:hypothetical protein